MMPFFREFSNNSGRNWRNCLTRVKLPERLQLIYQLRVNASKFHRRPAVASNNSKPAFRTWRIDPRSNKNHATAETTCPSVCAFPEGNGDEAFSRCFPGTDGVREIIYLGRGSRDTRHAGHVRICMYTGACVHSGNCAQGITLSRARIPANIDPVLSLPTTRPMKIEFPHLLFATTSSQDALSCLWR